MTRRARTRLATFAAVVAVAALIGAGYAALLDLTLRDGIAADTFLRGALRGALIAVVLMALELALAHSRLGRRLRRASFLAALLGHSLISTAILMLAIVVSRILLASRGHPVSQWLESGLPRDLAFAATAALLIHFVMQMRRIIGGRVLGSFLLGRYHRPVMEERIFMVLDIVGSTSLAARLGDVRAHALITRFFFDCAEPIFEHGGETHLYVGDEVVVTWPLGTAAENARPLRCWAAIRAMIAARRDAYLAEFGEAPDFRVGLHGGPVVAGECGDDKRQVVFIGDTINTAKRLQEACRDYDRPILVSGALLDRTALPPGLLAEPLGATVLRGRAAETRLFSLRSET